MLRDTRQVFFTVSFLNAPKHFSVILALCVSLWVQCSLGVVSKKHCLHLPFVSTDKDDKPSAGLFGACPQQTSVWLKVFFELFHKCTAHSCTEPNREHFWTIPLPDWEQSFTIVLAVLLVPSDTCLANLIFQILSLFSFYLCQFSFLFFSF